MCPPGQTGEGDSIPTSALQLWVERLDTEIALAACWHSRLPRLGPTAEHIYEIADE